jgi:hypothetical protein
VPEAPFPIVDVSEWDIVGDEASGAEAKYWLARPGTEERWLFKSVIIKQAHVHGEDWAEKAVAHLAHLIGIPCGKIDMAEWRGIKGCVSADLRPPGHELQPGQVLLEQCQAPGYVHRKGRSHPGHSLENIQRVLDSALPPPDCELAFSASAFDVFAGYVLMDAWVANRDRHDNNWAVLRPISASTDPLRLCGSFDHGNSLGFNVMDQERERLLAEPGGLPRWCGRGYADRFDHGQQRLSLVDLAAHALELCSAPARDYWLQGLRSVEPARVRGILARVPRMSESARSFTEKILQINPEEGSRCLHLTC